jgi:signal transduction histidine kinase
MAVSNPTARNGAERAGGGHGIVGMRERASLMGGTLEAGAAGGVFSTRARLPYRGTQP